MSIYDWITMSTYDWIIGTTIGMSVLSLAGGFLWFAVRIYKDYKDADKI